MIHPTAEVSQQVNRNTPRNTILQLSTPHILTLSLQTPTPGFPRFLESPGFFFIENSMTWKVLDSHFGPGKYWKLKLKVLECAGKISLKVMHFSAMHAMHYTLNIVSKCRFLYI